MKTILTMVSAAALAVAMSAPASALEMNGGFSFGGGINGAAQSAGSLLQESGFEGVKNGGGNVAVEQVLDTCNAADCDPNKGTLTGNAFENGTFAGFANGKSEEAGGDTTTAETLSATQGAAAVNGATNTGSLQIDAGSATVGGTVGAAEYGGQTGSLMVTSTQSGSFDNQVDILGDTCGGVCPDSDDVFAGTGSASAMQMSGIQVMGNAMSTDGGPATLTIGNAGSGAAAASVNAGPIPAPVSP